MVNSTTMHLQFMSNNNIIWHIGGEGNIFSLSPGRLTFWVVLPLFSPPLPPPPRCQSQISNSLHFWPLTEERRQSSRQSSQSVSDKFKPYWNGIKLNISITQVNYSTWLKKITVCHAILLPLSQLTNYVILPWKKKHMVTTACRISLDSELAEIDTMANDNTVS